MQKKNKQQVVFLTGPFGNGKFVLLYSISSVLLEKQITFHVVVVVVVVRQNASMCEYVHYITVHYITIDIVM